MKQTAAKKPLDHAVKYFKTFRIDSEGGQTETHLEGIGDSYTLCGLDTAGDPDVHAKPPLELPPGKHRLTCQHCKQIIALVRTYLRTTTNEPSGDSDGNAPNAQKPKWIRLPKPGSRCPYSALSRSKLNFLILPCQRNNFEPPIKSVSVINPVGKTGTRLILLSSLEAYIERCAKNCQPANNSPKARSK